MMNRLINLVILIPIGIVLIVLIVANRQTVTLALNPFDPQDAVLSLSAPFFLFLFASLILGLLLGSIATWFTQGTYRRRARRQTSEAVKWQTEAEKQRSRAEKTAAQAMVPTRSV